MEPIAKFTLTGKQTKDYFGMIKELSDECRLHIEPKKLYVALIGCANVAMIRTELTIDTNVKESVVIGVEPSRILAFTRIAKDTDPIDFEIVKTKEEPCIRLVCMDHSAKIVSISEPIIKKDPNPPTIALSHTLPVSGERIAEFFKLYPKRDGKFEVVIKDKKCMFKTHDEGTYSYTTIIANAPPGKARGIYSSDYLKSVFLRMKKLMITISISEDHPIKIVTDDNDIHNEIMVAPRIEGD
jgi:hypothetical protein